MPMRIVAAIDRSPSNSRTALGSCAGGTNHAQRRENVESWMPAKNPDLHGNVPDTSPVALILIDFINDLEFDTGAKLLRPAVRAAQAVAAVKEKARARGIPVIYANDNFGRWRSDFRQTVQHVLEDGVRGQP